MKMSFSTASDLVLITLWSLTMLVFLGGIVAINTPELISRADYYIRDHYLYEPPRRYAQLIIDYERDDDVDALLRGLVDLEKQLEPVQKGDELVATKRVVYAQLFDVLVREGDFENAGFWMERWLGFDSRDITALLRKGRLLVIVPETYAEGELLLGTLKQRFPNSFVVADGRANAWASIGQPGRAFSEYVPFLGEFEDLPAGLPEEMQTQTFTTLMQPRFRSLMIDQLRRNGRTEDLGIYEKLVTRP